MTPEELQSLRTRYGTDAEFRDRLDSASSAEAAVSVLAESGFDATASDLAQLGGAHVELDLDLIDQVSGGSVENELSDFNFTVN